MFKEILYPEQLAITRILSIFSRDFYLAGWTAIALQLWHRKSIDFDLFSGKEIKNSKILKTLKEKWLSIDRTLVDNQWEELTLIISGVKITFLYYPFDIVCSEQFEGISLPDLSILGSMKFYTLGRRGKWKDYVDIYFLIHAWYTLTTLSQIARSLFAGGYNEKLLREQLCYYDDIDMSEQVEYMSDGPSDTQVKEFLSSVAISQ